MRLRPQTVASAYLSEQVQLQPTPYKFLTPEAGWLLRQVWAFLNWVGVLEPYVARVTTWTYEPRAQKPLMYALMEAIQDTYLLDSLESGDGVIVMGPREWAELCKSPQFRDHTTFYAGPLERADPYRGRRVFDVPIHVVPNLSGFAVIPKVIIERQREHIS